MGELAWAWPLTPCNSSGSCTVDPLKLKRCRSYKTISVQKLNFRLKQNWHPSELFSSASFCIRHTDSHIYTHPVPFLRPDNTMNEKKSSVQRVLATALWGCCVTLFPHSHHISLWPTHTHLYLSASHRKTGVKQLRPVSGSFTYDRSDGQDE